MRFKGGVGYELWDPVGQWLLCFLAFFVPIDVLIDSIMKSKAKRLYGLTVEENDVCDVAHMSLKEISVFVIRELINIAFVLQPFLLLHIA